MQRVLRTCGRDLDPEVCGAPPGYFLYGPSAAPKTTRPWTPHRIRNGRRGKAEPSARWPAASGSRGRPPVAPLPTAPHHQTEPPTTSSPADPRTSGTPTSEKNNRPRFPRTNASALARNAQTPSRGASPPCRRRAPSDSGASPTGQSARRQPGKRRATPTRNCLPFPCGPVPPRCSSDQIAGDYRNALRNT